ncbi:MAG: ACT domain-containing protein [Ancrocorticia sp.]
MSDPIMNLDEILASLSVSRRGDFVYATVEAVPDGIPVLAAIWETEGLSVVVPVEAAEKLGTPAEPVFTCLTLDVYSALESVGLTATVATELADHGISCNVIAGLHHDHLLVPVTRADEAVRLLEALATKLF